MSDIKILNKTSQIRENKKYYIGMDENEQRVALKSLGENSLEDLFSHIPEEVKFTDQPTKNNLKYDEIKSKIINISKKNKNLVCFAGDGLQNYKQLSIVEDISNIRGLTTTYTPYQPEGSQGTLISLWHYSSILSGLTGFEAINASLYDGATAIYEALLTAVRLKRSKAKTIMIAESLNPSYRDVVKTLAKHTEFNVIELPYDRQTGLTSIESFSKLEIDPKEIAGFAYPQVNSLGLLEDVEKIDLFATDLGIKTIAYIDPMYLSNNGLKKPSEYGADMIVAEGQHLGFAPNFSGPGIGIFGIRYNKKDKLSIRQTPGRFVGKTKDKNGKDAFCLVLSTREQHIRREKATSNICSNQSFIATAIGASLLNRGENGLNATFEYSVMKSREFVKLINSLEGVEVLYKDSNYVNEVAIKLKTPSKEFIQKGIDSGLIVGVDISNRTDKENAILVSFTDIHNEHDIEKLTQFFKSEFKLKEDITPLKKPKLTETKNPFNFETHSHSDLINYYETLGKLNFSPDDAPFPLGSCTMKYNPYINDWAAGLIDFTRSHPQAPESTNQGNLEVLYEIEKRFKKITGLAAVTTQPVAGAQGELVGLKLIQAYHYDRGDEKRDTILIPRSAHGTNPASATFAGYKIKLIDSNDKGLIDIEKLKEVLLEVGKTVAGIMVTNPNTSGLFETKFHLMSELVHKAGGLVYMDGANMNAIAGIVNLSKLGVDAVHNNLHKTWSISHGGGGPGDGIVAVSEKLVNFLPGLNVIKEQDKFVFKKAEKTIGNFHRHHGNFAHKIRALTYLMALGDEGVVKMSQVAVLSARYLYNKSKAYFPVLPHSNEARMHEFIITLSDEQFASLATVGLSKSQAIIQLGKLFLDMGLHAPTVAFPEPLGLMIEPTESYTLKELDSFLNVLCDMSKIIIDDPQRVADAPIKTPVFKIDELTANKNLILKDDEVKLINIV